MDTDDTNGVLDLSHPPPPPPPQPVGIYGWRKRCIYAFILILMVVIIMNVALTVWILRILNISIDGMDKLKISRNGLRVDGEAEFLQTIYANKVQSKKGQSLYLMSNRNVQLLSTIPSNESTSEMVSSKLVVGQNEIEAKCDSFVVKDSNGRLKMSLDGDELRMGSTDVHHEGDIKLAASLCTPSIRSPDGEDLMLEASGTSGQVQVFGMAGVEMVTDAGSVIADAQESIMLTSTGGDIIIQSKSIYIRELPGESKSSSRSSSSSSTSYSASSSSSSSSSPSSSKFDTYQMCICRDGMLFKAAAESNCRAKGKMICV